MITLTIPGNPIPKARARVVNGHAFTPARTREWEAVVADHYRIMCGVKHNGPLAVELTFYRKDRRGADVDNLQKAVLDALNGIAWRDDSQIDRLISTVFRGCDEPRVTIEIVPFDGYDGETR